MQRDPDPVVRTIRRLHPPREVVVRLIDDRQRVRHVLGGQVGQLEELPQPVRVAPSRESRELDALAGLPVARSLGVRHQASAVLAEIELPASLDPFAPVTKRGERVEHLGFIFGAVAHEQPRTVRDRLFPNPREHRDQQATVEMPLLEPHLDLAVTVGKLVPRSVNPAEVTDRRTIALCDEAAVGESLARRFPTQAHDHRVLGHHVRRQLCVGKGGGPVADSGHGDRL